MINTIRGVMSREAHIYFGLFFWRCPLGQRGGAKSNGIYKGVGHKGAPFGGGREQVSALAIVSAGTCEGGRGSYR